MNDAPEAIREFLRYEPDARLRGAYLDLCERQVSKLQHEIAIEKATTDADLADLETRARVLANEIAAKKAALGR